MKHLIGIVLLTATTLSAQQASGDLSHFQFKYEDWDRLYWVHVPERYDPEQGGHLLLVLHGGGMQPEDMMRMTGRQFDALMADHNGIVVYPAGVEARWNDGRIRDDRGAFSEDIDDVGFLAALIDVLAVTYGIDPDQIYMAGFSNGAGMAYRFACEHADRVAAMGAVSGLLAATLDCQPDSPVAVLAMMGDEDPLIPLSGGDIEFDGRSLGAVHGLEETLAMWAEVNDCGPISGFDPLLIEKDELLPISPFVDCETPLQAYVVPGGGHTWPGAQELFGIAVYGRIGQQINAAEVIFSFMQAQGLGTAA